MGYIRREETKELASTTIELNGYVIQVSLIDRVGKDSGRLVCASAKIVRKEDAN